MKPAVARFLRAIRERFSQRATVDPPDYRGADSLRAERARTPELVHVSPDEDEAIEREIRKWTGT